MRDMRDEIDWSRLADYYAGRMPLRERAELERRLAADEGLRHVVAGLQEVWERAAQLRQPVGPVDVREAWAALQRRLSGGELRGAPGVASPAHAVPDASATAGASPTPAPAPASAPYAPSYASPIGAAGASAPDARRFRLLPRRESPWRRRVRPAVWAAAFAGLIAGGAALWHSGMGRAASDGDAPSGVREYRTMRGQRAVMRLVDGTRVALGPESVLRVRLGETGPRELELTGEAVFEVVHDAARPFVVRAGGVATEDLGTTFAMRAYPGEPVRVVVAEGVVAVGDTAVPSAARTVLTARELAIVGADGAIQVERGVDPAPYVAWKDGRLVLRRITLRDVVPQLERWFDIEIVVEDSALLDAAVNASFGDIQGDQVLRTLAATLDAAVEWRGRIVRLRDRERR